MQYRVHTIIKKIIEKEKENLKEPIYEFGSYQCYGADIENLRPLFSDMEYVGCDIREGNGVDQVMDITNILLEDGTIGVVICAETLEHVFNPSKAMEEVYRILQKGGLFILTSVFDFPIHDHPFDYFRFTPEIFKFWFEKYERSEVITEGGTEDKPVSIMGWGIK